MRYTQIFFLTLLVAITSCLQTVENPVEINDLSGTWKFELDPDNQGLEEKWFTRQLSDNIQIPGTTGQFNIEIILQNEILISFAIDQR